jgi:hypothetical protein
MAEAILEVLELGLNATEPGAGNKLLVRLQGVVT